MKVEKKYRVEDFARIKEKLHELGAKEAATSKSEHYYAQLSGNDVVKLVVHPDRSEIHKLKESGGKFSLTDRLAMGSLREGLQWLKRHGHQDTSLVRMAHSDFELEDGIVGLYVINDFLHSVILDFAEGEHEAIAHKLGLDEAEQIDAPYNKYLEGLGRVVKARYVVDPPGELYKPHNHGAVKLISLAGSLRLRLDGGDWKMINPGQEADIKRGQLHEAVVGDDGWEFLFIYEKAEADQYGIE